MQTATRVRPRCARGRPGVLALAFSGALTGAFSGVLEAAPFVPPSDATVLAELPRGVAFTPPSMRVLARSRLDVALPLAQFYIGQARSTGDLRFLGLAEAALAPWRDRRPPYPAALVLDATVLQSRHAFSAALAELDRALALAPEDAQAWLTRATILRVLGRYPEADAACARLGPAADPTITALCSEPLRGLSGQLPAAYAAVQRLPQAGLTVEARAWRYSELGEMAERLGEDAAAEHWFRAGLALAPEDAYLRAACADLLLRTGRPAEVRALLAGRESMETMLLRIAIAQKLAGDPALASSRRLLAAAFDVEQARGEAVHGREQARFLLDVEGQPDAALAVAARNWEVQHEPDDLLVLLRAARAARRPEAAAPALAFLRRYGLEDARLEPWLAAR